MVCQAKRVLTLFGSPPPLLRKILLNTAYYLLGTVVISLILLLFNSQTSKPKSLEPRRRYILYNIL